MDWRVGNLYKHDKMRDVAMSPVRITIDSNNIDNWSLEVEWYNIHYHELGGNGPFLIAPDYRRGQKPQTITLTKEQRKEWRNYDLEATKGILRAKVEE